MIHVAVYAPGEPILTDPHGSQTGYDPTTRKTFNSIPNAGYDPQSGQEDVGYGISTPKEGELIVLQPADGIYKLKITGAAEGKYDLYLELSDSHGNPAGRWHLVKVPISRGEVHQFKIAYQSTPSGEPNQFSGGFDGGAHDGKREGSRFLTYADPPESPLALPEGVSTLQLVIFYSPAVVTSTFSAHLNGSDVTGRFHPHPGGFEIVPLELRAGKNVLLLSIKGKLSSGRQSTDLDKLVVMTHQ